MRILYADQDEEYLNTCEVYNQATAFIKWVSSKYDSFNKMHYMCKKILDRGYVHERMSNFNGTTEFENNVEEEAKKVNKEDDEEWWNKS
jgi:hypothetical protein